MNLKSQEIALIFGLLTANMKFIKKTHTLRVGSKLFGNKIPIKILNDGRQETEYEKQISLFLDFAILLK